LPTLLLQKLAEQVLGHLGIPPTLDQHIKLETIPVDCPPQPMLRAGDRQHDFIHMPFVATPESSTAQLGGDLTAGHCHIFVELNGPQKFRCG
jgi:hypothetical protein